MELWLTWATSTGCTHKSLTVRDFFGGVSKKAKFLSSKPFKPSQLVSDKGSETG